MARRRLDAELVRRGLARSRDHAVDLVSQGRVLVAGTTATKPATQVETSAAIILGGDPEPGYVSRGGFKLAGALDDFAGAGLVVDGRRCLDAGASTGGFTDVLLRRGAVLVVAVDVGYGQLAWAVRSDERVVVRDRTNVRHLLPTDLDDVGGPVDLVVADLSFISLLTVLPSLRGVARERADLVLMVKPQFEVGREGLRSGGVVRDPSLRFQAVRRVAAHAAGLALGTRAVTASQLPGPAGNVEYFLWLSADVEDLVADALDGAISRAIEEGPS